MRIFLAYVAGIITAILTWMIPTIVLDLNNIRIGALPAVLTGGFALWVGMQVTYALKRPRAARTEEAVFEGHESDDSPSTSDTGGTINAPHAKTKGTLAMNNIANVAILFLLTGIAVGYAIENN